VRHGFQNSLHLHVLSHFLSVWDLRLSQWLSQRIVSSGIWRRGVWYKYSDISTERSVPILRLEDGGVTLLQNFCKFVAVYTASHFRGQYFSVYVSSSMQETAFRSHTQCVNTSSRIFKCELSSSEHWQYDMVVISETLQNVCVVLFSGFKLYDSVKVNVSSETLDCFICECIFQQDYIYISYYYRSIIIINHC
jgi:hypothetical protein